MFSALTGKPGGPTGPGTPGGPGYPYNLNKSIKDINFPLYLIIFIKEKPINYK